MSTFVEGLSNAARTVVSPLGSLCARLYVGLIFLQAGLSKLDDWPATLIQFKTDWIIPVLSSTVSAWLATAGEVLLSILLMLGLYTRFAASGLLIIVLVIEFVVFNAASAEREYYYWMIILLMLVGYGGDRLSLDQLLIWRKSRRSLRRFH